MKKLKTISLAKMVIASCLLVVLEMLSPSEAVSQGDQHYWHNCGWYAPVYLHWNEEAPFATCLNFNHTEQYGTTTHMGMCSSGNRLQGWLIEMNCDTTDCEMGGIARCRRPDGTYKHNTWTLTCTKDGRGNLPKATGGDNGALCEYFDPADDSTERFMGITCSEDGSGMTKFIGMH